MSQEQEQNLSQEQNPMTEEVKLSEEQQFKEQLLRVKADFENVKKRLEKDRLEAVKYANERLLAQLLDVTDNFDRAMESLAQGHDVQKVQQGLKLTQNELHKVLEANGVELVKSVGEIFDPRFHEAVGMLETKDFEDGVVVDEVGRGYLLNGRLIRPSKVRVAQKID